MRVCYVSSPNEDLLPKLFFTLHDGCIVDENVETEKASKILADKKASLFSTKKVSYCQKNFFKSSHQKRGSYLSRPSKVLLPKLFFVLP
tara:strand:+ start:327 stop:593 length:267 start_codon:yes stop_codon:yes gene_type:complete